MKKGEIPRSKENIRKLKRLYNRMKDLKKNYSLTGYERKIFATKLKLRKDDKEF
jgi:uncharacterized protein (UPF0335 family)